MDAMCLLLLARGTSTEIPTDGAVVLQKSQRRLGNGAVGKECATYYGHIVPSYVTNQRLCQSTMCVFSMSYVTGTLDAYI